MTDIENGRFAIVSNGFADGPAQALRDFLVGRGAWVITVFHPLVPEAGKKHEIVLHLGGEVVRRRSVRLPLGPPWSFALDSFIPVCLPPVDVWFGFNSLTCSRGLVARRLHRARTVVYWCVDFVPDRFGRGPVTRIYDALDRACCRRVDLRFELSDAARQARDSRHELEQGQIAPVRIVPMGAWLERTPKVPEDAWSRRRVVFLGHLVERQGVGVLLDALAILNEGGAGVRASVIGGGPLEEELRARARGLGLEDTVTFSGFVEDHRVVEAALADASVAVAPYQPRSDNFTRYADPGKLKAYLAAGLPILLTDVPPNARSLAAEGGAEIVSYDALSLATAIERALGDGPAWGSRRAAALRHARSFDWPVVLGEALESVPR